jgi:hypothetical protein
MKRLGTLWLFDWRKVLVYTHRWLGIAGGMLFVAWFLSGIVMMYARMPGLADEERLARAPVLDLSTVTVAIVLSIGGAVLSATTMVPALRRFRRNRPRLQARRAVVAATSQATGVP